MELTSFLIGVFAGAAALIFGAIFGAISIIVYFKFIKKEAK